MQRKKAAAMIRNGSRTSATRTWLGDVVLRVHAEGAQVYERKAPAARLRKADILHKADMHIVAPLESRRKTRHNHDNRNLHGSLHCHHEEIGFHPARDLLQIGLGLLNFKIKPEIGRQQITEALYCKYGDNNERGYDPPEFRVSHVEKTHTYCQEPACR